MQKFLLIALLIGVIVYFLMRKVVKLGNSMAVQRSTQQGFYLIEGGTQHINGTIKKTMYSVGVGVILLLVTLLLAMKVKILLLMLPISIYLISQLFLLNNQLKYAKDQRIWFNPTNQDVLIEWLSGNQVRFNLLRDVQQVKTVKAVQKNNQVLFGYYELTVHNNQIYIPFLLAENQLNQRFFQTLKDNYNIQSKSSLFPMI